MSLNDEGLTLEQLDKNVKQRLAQDHFHNIIEAIKWASYNGRREITVRDWTPDECQMLVEIGLDVDDVGDGLWIHWPEQQK